MTLRVLGEKTQISAARRELNDLGVSTIDTPFRALLRRIGVERSIAVGDWVKSWDLLATLRFIEGNIKKNEPVLDIGCYASEILVALHRLGYSNLTGVDLNPDVGKMPYADQIRYANGNFLHTPFEDFSFKAISSISVIEHGFSGAELLHEMSRLLMPGGYFIASFDYWQEKIDTTGTKFFDMDWKIFSQAEVFQMIQDAAQYGLHPVGELQPQGKDRVIHCGGKDYTFGWLVLQKR